MLCRFLDQDLHSNTSSICILIPALSSVGVVLLMNFGKMGIGDICKQVQDFHRRADRRKRTLYNCTAVLQISEGSQNKNSTRLAS